MKKYIVLALLLAVCFSLGFPFSSNEIQHEAGILLPEAPYQVAVEEKLIWKRDTFVFKALAEFEVEDRVLSRARYWFDASAVLSPIDLALGWGVMSDSALLSKLDISQSGRFYCWKMREQTEVSVPEIVRSSANMHLIPATEEIESAMKSVQKNDLVWIKGYLVEVNSADGFHWKSSLTRNDAGAGACEIIWVEQLEWIAL